MAILEKILVKKDQLIETLNINRGLHEQIWNDAKNEYIKSARLLLKKKLCQFDDCEDFNKLDLGFPLSKPQNYLSNYNDSLEMLKWHRGEEVELGHVQFKNYVLDEWSWTHDFLVETSGCSSLAYDTYTSKYSM